MRLSMNAQLKCITSICNFYKCLAYGGFDWFSHDLKNAFIVFALICKQTWNQINC